MGRDWNAFVENLTDDDQTALLRALIGWLNIGDSAPVIVEVLDGTDRGELLARLADAQDDEEKG